MSSGRSSQVAACFSLERTKYLMLSKWMPSRLEPQFGIGLRSKMRSAFSRCLQHPLRLALLGRDVTDHRFGQPALGAGARDVGVGPAVAVPAHRGDGLFLGERFGQLLNLGGGRHDDAPCLLAVASTRAERRRVERLLSGPERDMGGACAVTVDDGRQPLHVGPEHLGHGLLLGFTQLRELLGDVRHRAVVLTDLHAVDRAAHLGGGCDVTRLGQRAGNLTRRWLRCPRRRPNRPPRHRTGSRRCAAGRRCEPRPHRRFPGVDASPPTPGRRSCGPAWRGRPRSAGSAWPVGRGPPAATAAAGTDSASPASISASRWRRTPAAERPSRSPICPAVIDPDSSSNRTTALRVWPSCVEAAGAAASALLTSGRNFTTQV